MRVVLGEAPDAGEAVEFTGLLVAVDGSELSEAHRQVAVAPRPRLEDFAMVGTVHGLQQVLLPFVRGVDGLEAVLPVLGIVPGGDVQVLVADVGRDDGLVTGPALGLLEKGFEAHAEVSPLGEPKRQPLPHLLTEMKEVHLLAEFAVVAGAGLLQQLEVLIELRLFREGHAIDARELLVLFVALPVGAGDGHDLRRLDEARVRDVWSAAEIGEVALRIKGDGPIFEAFEQVEFVLVALLREVGRGFCLGHGSAGEGGLGFGQIQHLLLHRRKVLVGEGVLPEIHVVVEPVLQRRPDPKLHPRVQRLERLGQQVGRTVPHGLLARVVAPGEELQLSVFLDGALGIADFAVDLGGQHVPGEAFADARGDVQGSRSGCYLADGAVGQGNVNHGVPVHRLQK